jgi:Domain of unknown function (DUF4331)
MSDRFSGLQSIADPAADITDMYAFPSPDRPGHLVLVLNVFPAAAEAALFSDAINYRFRVRPVARGVVGTAPAFVVGEDEYAFTFTFTAPVPGSGSVISAQAGLCTAPGGRQVSFRLGDDKTAQARGLRVFAGTRLGPSHIDSVDMEATWATGKLAFRPEAANSLDGMNVLSIVLDIDAAAVFGPGGGPLLAVVGETVTSGWPAVRLQRMGRPEIKNVIMSPKKLDQVNGDLEIQDRYNAEDPFSLSPDYLGACRSRLKTNLAFLDRLDGKTDWPLDHLGTHPLTELLLADFLVLDMSKPFSEDSWFEIEAAMLAGRPHTSCGGRPLNDDIIDTLYPLLVGGVDGPRISDGVGQAARSAARTFPYLAGPNPNPPDLVARLAALLAPSGSAAR